ncbi:MAG: DASS family sodium-coupled anion symporter [Thermoplasmatales archaeon]|nr:DASS family sodium-coupled anion symporter [Thermoplasmatales archaeon]
MQREHKKYNVEELFKPLNITMKAMNGNHVIPAVGRLSSSSKDIFFILFAFFIVIVFYFLPTFGGLPNHNAQIMLGILLMAVVLWSTEALPLAVTGLLIILLQPLLGVMPAGDVFSNFGNKAIFFIIGSFMLAAAIEKHGLHRRIALKMLSVFHHGPKTFLFGVMIVGGFLSFLMAEHAVAVLLLPVLVHILVSMKLTPRQSNFGIATMLALTYGTSIGSWGTLLGGNRNPLTMGFLAEKGFELTFLEWTKMTLPMVLLTLPLIWVILILFFPPEVKDMSRVKEEMANSVKDMGGLSKGELKVLGIYAVTIGMWVFLSNTIGVAVIALIGAMLMFLFRVVNWKDVEEHVQWGIILLYGGAITLGIGLQQTGAAGWIANNVMGIVGNNPYIALIVLIAVGFILTEMMSNTAAVALLLPIGWGIASQIAGLSPVATCLAIALAGGGSFMLVIATPSAAIAYSSGYFSTRHLMRVGIIANLVCMATLFFIAIVYWQWILGL